MGLKRSRLPTLPRVQPTTLEVLGGWGEGVDDPADAEAAVVYGQWADLLYLKLAFLFLGAALADLVLWAASGSWLSLLGPSAVLTLCAGYLYRRRRFRTSVRQKATRVAHHGAVSRSGRSGTRSPANAGTAEATEVSETTQRRSA